MGRLVKAVTRDGDNAKPTFDEGRFLQEAGAIAARLQSELIGGLNSTRPASSRSGTGASSVRTATAGRNRSDANCGTNSAGSLISVVATTRT